GPKIKYDGVEEFVMTDPIKTIQDSSALTRWADDQLAALKAVISNMDIKRGKSFISWLETQNRYLLWEENFNPKKNKRYVRGEVVHVQFGFNTGSEHGGPHWAVVLDDNALSSPTVLVMPLGSLEDTETEAD